MHTFGHPVRIVEIANICNEYHIELLEDAAESIGSTYHGKHTGTFGKIGAISFNGNKTITTGGGGMMLFQDKELGALGKHLTTQAKIPHRWEFRHDHIGYNYRMPNINAALGCAQLEMLDEIIESKRNIAAQYIEFFIPFPEAQQLIGGGSQRPGQGSSHGQIGKPRAAFPFAHRLGCHLQPLRQLGLGQIQLFPVIPYALSNGHGIPSFCSDSTMKTGLCKETLRWMFA
jgi:hypothetical protein